MSNCGDLWRNFSCIAGIVLCFCSCFGCPYWLVILFIWILSIYLNTYVHQCNTEMSFKLLPPPMLWFVNLIPFREEFITFNFSNRKNPIGINSLFKQQQKTWTSMRVQNGAQQCILHSFCQKGQQHWTFWCRCTLYSWADRFSTLCCPLILFGAKTETNFFSFQKNLLGLHSQCLAWCLMHCVAQCQHPLFTIVTASFDSLGTGKSSAVCTLTIFVNTVVAPAEVHLYFYKKFTTFIIVC